MYVHDHVCFVIIPRLQSNRMESEDAIEDVRVRLIPSGCYTVS